MGLRRDGVILDLNAGHGLGELRPAADSVGRKIDQVWPNTIANLVKQVARKAIATRNTVESRFQQGGRDYHVRASAQGPDRALCVIQPVALPNASADTVEITAEHLPGQFDRRGFLKRFKETVAMASLRETPLAVAIINIEGISDVAQSISHKISEQIMTTAILRLCAENREPQDRQAPWYLGQLSDSQLALVLESADREAIESRVEEVCAGLREPVRLGGNVFKLRPSAGIAIHAQDAPSARGLLDHAQAAASEARRGEQGKISFFTEKLRLKSLLWLDLSSELRQAIASRGISLRYVERHDLASGKLVTYVGYMRWHHSLRGDIRPLDFLRIAESTGLGLSVSRAALQRLEAGYQDLPPKTASEARISFGPLRHHIASDEFVSDILQLLEQGVIPAERLEIRIAKKDIGARRPEDFKPLADAGVHLLMDEVGRGPVSIEWLANSPFHGLQLKRELVLAAREDAAALRICRAALALGRSLGLVSSATGIDSPEARSLLLEAGCQQGAGDLYPLPNLTSRI
jgi:predicted signal transduction protein with EAL and GGDEF domain